MLLWKGLIFFNIREGEKTKKNLEPQVQSSMIYMCWWCHWGPLGNH